MIIRLNRDGVMKRLVLLGGGYCTATTHYAYMVTGAKLTAAIDSNSML